ncbi:MAG: hypothetical protein KF726_05175 [Anaerolineae bacterium]|nr:hypothetical protein [Anaerolineae bacterium]
MTRRMPISGRTEWFEHLAERRSPPVTNCIRRPHEIEFTPLPDHSRIFSGIVSFSPDR